MSIVIYWNSISVLNTKPKSGKENVRLLPGAHLLRRRQRCSHRHHLLADPAKAATGLGCSALFSGAVGRGAPGPGSFGSGQFQFGVLRFGAIHPYSREDQE